MSFSPSLQPAAYIINYFIVSLIGLLLYGVLLCYYCKEGAPTNNEDMMHLSALFRWYSFVLIPLWLCYTGFSTASLIYWVKDDFMDRLKSYRIAYGWVTFVSYLILVIIAMLRKTIIEAAQRIQIATG